MTMQKCMEGLDVDVIVGLESRVFGAPIVQSEPFVWWRKKESFPARRFQEVMT